MSARITEGQVLAGKYRVERVLGKGGMGMVVAAMHQQLQQRVAVKFLLPDATPEMIQRFLREARAAVRLKSEHVARVIDVDTLEDGTPYMVMEYLEGVDLSQRVRQAGPLPIDEAVTYVLQACEAIAEAHAAGIVHRDIKPANLFLTTAADGSQMVKVLDFGIVKALADATDEAGPDGQAAMALTRTAAIIGSPLYMSPEQLMSARSVDSRADIWSMGVVLFQLLTGRLPFEAREFGELFGMLTTQPPSPPRLFRADLPEELEAAILGCLRKPREERFQHVGELALAIAPFSSPEAQVSVPRILRTLGVAASSPPSRGSSIPFGSRSSFPPFRASAVSTAPSAVSTAPASEIAPSRPPSQPPARASLPPRAFAPAAQAPSGPESRVSSSTGDVVERISAAPGARPAARRGAAGAMAAAVVALLTMTGGAIVVSQLWARTEDEADVSLKANVSREETAPQAVEAAPAPVNKEETAPRDSEVEPAPPDPAPPAPTLPAPTPPTQKIPTAPAPPNAAPRAPAPQPKRPPSPGPTSTPAQGASSAASDTSTRRESPMEILMRRTNQNQQGTPNGQVPQ
ncbi:protein kinase domain-containing protein [Sorangium sp. So ce1335]|uniref:serine/threonine-protein kinase n=1 Tax=Sorangium sp. So ce1335 TaxID=3133335 RepID=UPI003F5D8176